MQKKGLLVSTLTTLLMISSCGPTSGPTSGPTIDPTTSGTSTSIPQTHEGITLDYFIMVNESNSNEVNEAISYFSNLVETEYGAPFVLMNKEENSSRFAYEIIVGDIYRDETYEYYKHTDFGDIVYKTVVTEEKLTLYIGGYSDYETSIAIYELADAFKNKTLLKDDGNLNLDFTLPSNINEIYFSDDELREYNFVINKNLKDKVKETANLLVRDFNRYLNNDATMSEDAYGSSTAENYKKTIYIGMVDEASFEIGSDLRTNEYDIRSIRHGDDIKIYVSGVSNQITIHSIQNWYRQIVVNGNLAVRKYFQYDASPISRRDPCIVPYEGVYYLYSSHGTGYQVETSTDLRFWSSPKTIFDSTMDPNFKGIGDYWAPECHYYNGKFYLIATYKSSLNNHRGCGVWVSDTPDGKFELISDNHITPFDWDAIDGTLYVDPSGQPYMVFVHEWTSLPNGIGRMCYAKLSDDLSRFISEPVEIFAADDPVWTDQCVTDGCYMYRTQDGELLMIWSNFANEGFSNYTIGIAKSDNGDITGNWIQQETVLHTNDNDSVYSVFNGGHGMIFEGFDGNTYITFHAPNDAGEWMTMVMYLPIIEKDGTIVLDLIK